MRMNLGYQSKAVSKDRLFELDFHDFIQKSMILNDMEIAREFGVTTPEVEALKHRIRR